MSNLPTTYNVYDLAAIAGVYVPDSEESPGARFLLRVQDSANEAREDRAEYPIEYEDVPHAIAFHAPAIGTHQLWQEFVDLAAYREDVSEFGPVEDLTAAARVALYLIANRLAERLLTGNDWDDDQEFSG